MISNWINHKISRAIFTLWWLRLLKSWVVGYRVYTLNREQDCVIHFVIVFYKVIKRVVYSTWAFEIPKPLILDCILLNLRWWQWHFISLSTISRGFHIWLQIWCSFSSLMLKHAYLFSSMPLCQCFLLLKIQLSELCIITTFL